MTSEKFPEPVFKLKETVTEPVLFKKLYFKRYRCTIYTAVVFEIGAASLEILTPWLVGLYFFHPEIKDDYKMKHDLMYVLYFLLFFISFCSWVRGYMITRAIEKMAKEMRYDIYHNYIVELETTRIKQKITNSLAAAFGSVSKGKSR